MIIHFVHEENDKYNEGYRIIHNNYNKLIEDCNKLGKILIDFIEYYDKMAFFKGGILEEHEFFRIYRTFLVNHKFIKAYNKLDSSILMANRVKLAIAKRKKNEFLEFIGNLYPVLN